MCLRCGFGIDSLDSRASFGPLTTYADADTIEIVPLSCAPAWKTGSKLETRNFYSPQRPAIVDRKTLATDRPLAGRTGGQYSHENPTKFFNQIY